MTIEQAIDQLENHLLKLLDEWDNSDCMECSWGVEPIPEGECTAASIEAINVALICLRAQEEGTAPGN